MVITLERKTTTLIVGKYFAIFLSSMAQQPLVGQSLLNIEALLSETPHSVGVLWMTD